MSSPDPHPASGDRPASRGSPAIWHPAREWLEEDEEDDMDYDPETEISEHSEDRPHPDEDHFIDEDDEDGFYGVQLNYLGIVVPPCSVVLQMLILCRRSTSCRP